MNTSAMLEFLADPRSYPDSPEKVERVETHVSWVFLAGAYVYKIKKPVKFDFLDFSTLSAREKACEREVRVNRRLAPDVYLDVLPIYETSAGWSFKGEEYEGGVSLPVEYCVRMRRLPADLFLSRLIETDQLAPAQIDALADVLVEFYRTCKTSEKIARAASAANFESMVRANLKVLRDHDSEAENLDRVESAQLEFLGRNEALFEERAEAGKVRDCHGDLRAEHIVLTDPPAIFDCIEFNDRYRHIDFIDDIAFLVMDLDRLGRSDVGRRLWSTLADRLGERGDEPLFDFYRAYRATVRAKVHVLRAAQATDEGQKAAETKACESLLALAAEYCRRFHHPRLIVTIGLMGTGKSTLAQALANTLGLHKISSDNVRREIFGGEGRMSGFGQGVYRPDQVEKVYRELFRRALGPLSRGASVVIDATFLKREHRAAALELAKSTAAEPLFLECRLPKTDAIARLDQRFRKNRTSSDGRPEFYEDQKITFEPLDDLPANMLVSLNTSQPVPALVDAVLASL